MPEYLAPGVYVEEVPSGNKPIQGASTSTTGMVGLTDSGPVGTPTLVTSLASYAKTFGGKLDPSTHPAGYATLPFAAEGFFANGGARLYVVRVAGPNARASAGQLHAAATAGPASVLQATSPTGGTELVVADNSGFSVGDSVLVGSGQASEIAEIASADAGVRHVLLHALQSGFPDATPVVVQAATALAGATVSAAAPAGAEDLQVTDSSGIDAGQYLLLSNAAGHELIHVGSVETRDSAGGTTHILHLQLPLEHGYEAGATLSSLADDAASGSTTLAGRAAAGVEPGILALADPAAVAAADIISLTDGDTVEMAQVAAAFTAMQVTGPLGQTHEAGSAVAQLEAVLDVHARWPGEWGDALRVTLSPAALAATELTQELQVGQQVLQVSNALGLHPGSVLLVGPAATGETLVVDSVELTGGNVHLRTPAQQLHLIGSGVSSREFTLLSELIDQGRATRSERFENLSLDPAHPRFAPGVIGAWLATGPADEGASELIRVAPLAAAAPSGAPVTGLGQYLHGGTADAASITPEDFKGTAAIDPGLRTGIQALENETSISLVAVPGISALVVQKALVAHCEKMRYRFAVLDVPAGSSMNEARAHRQNFDTTRAALYYPYVRVSNPFGAPGALLDLAPSGHLLGLYARVDNTRGVHKAPANEILRSIQSLQVALGKGEQDILNPINLNALRDFRSENRGLRVYGGRVATSDPEWKYINVRRLALFIEQSVDIGLQWAVFEPNDKPLWDAVKQSVTGFLDTVWRSGALAGTKQEQAFFVNIGFNLTMSQADIDNGMLVIEVGFAPVKPAEFVIFRLSQKTIEATQE